MVHDDLSHRLLQAALAVELRVIRTGLEELAATLLGDPYFAATHLGELQAFDWLGQCADETSGVLERLAAGQHPRQALASVRLDLLQDRLGHALDAVEA